MTELRKENNLFDAKLTFAQEAEKSIQQDTIRLRAALNNADKISYDACWKVADMHVFEKGYFKALRDANKSIAANNEAVEAALEIVHSMNNLASITKAHCGYDIDVISKEEVMEFKKSKLDANIYMIGKPRIEAVAAAATLTMFAVLQCISIVF